MMNVSNLFTPTGLTQAIKLHHKNLHQTYNFPPLSGLKPIHKFAEAFSFKSAEPFLNALDEAFIKDMSATVNLVQGNKSSIVHAEIEKDEGAYQVRVMEDGDASFIICNIDPSRLANPRILYKDSQCAAVFFGAVAVVIEIDHQQLEASVFETKDKSHFNTSVIPHDDFSEDSNIEIIDSQYAFGSSTSTMTDRELGFTEDDYEELADSFDKALQAIGDNLDDFIIPATVVSDDDQVNIDFDAVEYFESELKNGNIEKVFEALEGCGFDADYPTDTIAEFFSEESTSRLFTYLESVDKNVDLGYRCTVDRKSAFKWLHNAAMSSLRNEIERNEKREQENKNNAAIRHFKFLSEYRYTHTNTEIKIDGTIVGTVNAYSQVFYHNGNKSYIFSTVEDFADFYFLDKRNMTYYVEKKSGLEKSNTELVNGKPHVLTIKLHGLAASSEVKNSYEEALLALKEKVLEDTLERSMAHEVIPVMAVYGETEELSKTKLTEALQMVVNTASESTLIHALNFIHESAQVTITKLSN
jgi:hypothetical protein